MRVLQFASICLRRFKLLLPRSSGNDLIKSMELITRVQFFRYWHLKDMLRRLKRYKGTWFELNEQNINVVINHFKTVGSESDRIQYCSTTPI